MIYLGSDHGGFELKEKVKQWLEEWGYEYEDCGAFELDPTDDYPDYAFAVAQKVAKDQGYRRRWEQARVFGILACRSAAGVVIAANKINGVRAAAAFDIKSAKHMRKHNDANVLAVSGDWLDEKMAKDIVKTFLETEFSGAERHKRRLRKVADLEVKSGK